MSIPIRQPLRGLPILLCPHAFNRAKAWGGEKTKSQSFVATVLAWMGRSAIATTPKACFSLDGYGDRVMRRRESRHMFQNWAASDLAHRDVASQIWPAFTPH